MLESALSPCCFSSMPLGFFHFLTLSEVERQASGIRLVMELESLGFPQRDSKNLDPKL